MTSDTWKPDIVIYHKNCLDGFTAAWSVWKRFNKECTYIAADYGDPPPPVKDKNILIVDFSYSEDTLLKMSKEAISIVVLDHHETAEEFLSKYQIQRHKTISLEDIHIEVESRKRNDISDILITHFDMCKSGARLTWECVNGDSYIPELVRLVEDRDLWLFTYPDTRKFGIWLATRNYLFEEYDDIQNKLDSTYSRSCIMEEAGITKTYFDYVVREIASSAEFRNICGYEVISVNCPLMFRSEVGNYLLEMYPTSPFSATFFESKDRRKWSLRSTDDRENVAKIARAYGGGGHHNASSFNEYL